MNPVVKLKKLDLPYCPLCLGDNLKLETRRGIVFVHCNGCDCSAPKPQWMKLEEQYKSVKQLASYGREEVSAALVSAAGRELVTFPANTLRQMAQAQSWLCGLVTGEVPE